MQLAKRSTSRSLTEFPELTSAALGRVQNADRADLGQFFTPSDVARLMASMFSARDTIRLLDPGAGIGSLSAAFVERLLESDSPPRSIELVAYEVDENLVECLADTLEQCRLAADRHKVVLTWKIEKTDFIIAAVNLLRTDLFQKELVPFDCVITNPPYRKLRSSSRHRSALSSVGIEVSNLYAAFVALSLRLLRDGGELVAITPRSFCNGSYFASFRNLLLEIASIDRIHIFGSRAAAFSEDSVLQENVIVKTTKTEDQTQSVEITSSEGRRDRIASRVVSLHQVVRASDVERVIHIPHHEQGNEAAAWMAAMPCSLGETGLQVSTGRVVDFRVRELLRDDCTPGTVPLLYPASVKSPQVIWPADRGNKPVALERIAQSEKLLVPAGFYVLVKRFTSKEERRRIVAGVVDPSAIPAAAYAFENHLNFFHVDGRGMDPEVAIGLATFLNSSQVDLYFRGFSGHTQVNVGDLKRLRYPSREMLSEIGCIAKGGISDQNAIDDLVGTCLSSFVKVNDVSSNPQEKRVAEALDALIQLGLPREQQNDRSALALLALLMLPSDKSWSEAAANRIGVTPIMEFAAEQYGRQYAPNSRETFRRFTLHQFVAAGLVVANPDRPDRPTNSPKYCYEIADEALETLRTYGTPGWNAAKASYLDRAGSLKERYAQARTMERIPLRIAGTEGITLSPGDHNELVVQILDEFCPRFTPDAKAVYVGDTADKFAYFNRELLEELGVSIASHGKMPDVVVYVPGREWLVLVEAVTSHGPVNPKRHEELNSLFAGCTAGLVFVTAFLKRRDLTKYLSDIAWETEVWVAESPTHLIHFDGVRFLGPYSYKKSPKNR